MPLSLVQGRFMVKGAAPDGDSVRFVPAAADAFARLKIPVRANAAGGVQLRLDGIDALETHYAPRVGGGVAGVQHQPLKYADAAAAELLRWLGFSGVQRDDRERVTEATPDSVNGYLLTRFADKYGRCVSFAFRGGTRHADLSSVRLDPAALRASANWHLMSQGLVYPTFYSKLYPDLRAELAAAATAARESGDGLWPEDRTQAGVTVRSLATLTDSAPVLPKLFRRLVDYLALGAGDVSLAGFPAFLAARDDRLLVLSDGHVTGFDTVVSVRRQNVRLSRSPADLVFLER